MTSKNLIWSGKFFPKSFKTNAWFGLIDRFEVHFDHVRMPAGSGIDETKGPSLNVLSAIKRVLLL